jgi:transposase
MEIKILFQQGHSVRHIAKQLGMSRNTVKKYLASSMNKPCYQTRPSKKQKLDDYKSYLEERQRAASPGWIPATVLYREICAKGYKGSISLLRAFMVSVKKPTIKENIVRFETLPGLQMQIDWAVFSKGSCRLSAFIATLGYSRMSYVEFVNNERLETLLGCLINAFEYFGGSTQQLLFDNMKTVVLKRDAYAQGQHRFQPTLWHFAKHYGFMPKLCKPYRAQTKGKVERFISYLRHSFYLPLRAQLAQVGLTVNIHTANVAVKNWLNQIANCRIHAGLREKPHERFRAEQPLLLRLPPTPYELRLPTRVISHELTLPAHPVNDLHQEPIQHDLQVYQTIFNQQLGESL